MLDDVSLKAGSTVHVYVASNRLSGSCAYDVLAESDAELEELPEPTGGYRGVEHPIKERTSGERVLCVDGGGAPAKGSFAHGGMASRPHFDLSQRWCRDDILEKVKQVYPVEEAELRYQIRRLSAHPSIAMCKTLMLCRSDPARRLANQKSALWGLQKPACPST